MNTEELKEFEQWVRSNHPDIIDAFVSRNSTLDTKDKTPFPLKFSPEQEKVLRQIWDRINADADNAKYVGWDNWGEIPYIGEEVHEELEDGAGCTWERYKRVDLGEILEEYFPLGGNDDDLFFEDEANKKKFSQTTNGKINEILLFLRDKANTSVTVDW